MSGVVVVLWLGSAAARLEAEPELDAWARARLVELADARPAGTAAADYDDDVVRRIEQLLEQARVATDTLDEATALTRLGDAEALLAQHPELPQAAWLSAERLLAEAALRDRQKDGAVRARALRAGARGLGERRVAPLAETSAPGTDAPETAPAPLEVRLAGPMPQDRVFWDGRPVGARLATASGLHHVRVVRAGRALWAGWTAVPETGGALALPVPAARKCSLDDLGSTAVRGTRVVPPPQARCRAWAVARPAASGIEVASCRGNRCGELVTWPRGAGDDFTGPPQSPPDRSLPAWIFVAAGIGAAALTGTLLWQAGVFDDPEPAQDRVLFTGPAR